MCSGKFSPSRITHTELLILQSLDWLANPPTTISFIMHLLLLLPDNMSLNSKREIFESSRFLAGMFMYDLILSIHANMNWISPLLCTHFHTPRIIRCRLLLHCQASLCNCIGCNYKHVWRLQYNNHDPVLELCIWYTQSTRSQWNSCCTKTSKTLISSKQRMIILLRRITPQLYAFNVDDFFFHLNLCIAS